jgi:hypothetical protein
VIGNIVNIAQIVGTIVALITLIVYVSSYVRQNSAKRFEIFQGMNRRFDAQKVHEIRTLLDADDIKLAAYDHTEKANFVAFFEEVAISVNSKVMNKEVAHSIFGYWAIKCSDSRYFWKDEKMLCKNSPYWSLFRDFVAKMRLMKADLEGGKTKLNKLRF